MEEILMSQESLDKLKKELEYLKKEKMPEIIERIDSARQLGDLSENAEYHEAKDDQGMAAARIRELESKIENATIVSATGGSAAVSIGSKLTVEDEEGNTREYEIVDQTQADPIEGKISNESPIGAAFMNRSEGDVVEVDLPSGKKEFTIKKVS